MGLKEGQRGIVGGGNGKMTNKKINKLKKRVRERQREGKGNDRHDYSRGRKMRDGEGREEEWRGV